MIEDDLDRLAAALQALPAHLLDTTEQVLQDNTFLLELENQQQLEAGLDSNDRPITPDYAPLTRLLKQEAGQPYDRVTLHDTGAYYASITAQVQGGQLEYSADDPNDLAGKYGEAILGLSPEGKEQVETEVLLPELEAEARKTLGL